MTKPKYKVGDWIRFMSNYSFVIGKVEYINKTVVGRYEYYTDSGIVAEDSVLEARSNKGVGDES